MTIAISTNYFSTSTICIYFTSDRTFDLIIKARPATTGMKLVPGTIQWKLTLLTYIHAGFFEIMGDRVSQLETRLENIAFKSIPARLADLLLRRGEINSALKVYDRLGGMLLEAEKLDEAETQQLNALLQKILQI